MVVLIVDDVVELLVVVTAVDVEALVVLVEDTLVLVDVELVALDVLVDVDDVVVVGAEVLDDVELVAVVVRLVDVALELDAVELLEVLVVDLVLLDEEEVDVVDVEEELVLEVVLVLVVGPDAQVHSVCAGACVPLEPLRQTLQVSVAENAREKMRTSSMSPLNCRVGPPSLFPSSLTVIPVLQSAPVRATGGSTVPFTYSVRFAPS